MSIASRIESIETHLEDAYDTIEAKGVNLHLLPPEYKQVNYILSSGTQYIDTGYLVKGDLKIVTDIEYVSSPSGNQAIFGGRNSYNSKNHALYLVSSTKFKNDYNNLASNALPNISNLLTKWHIVKDKGNLTITSSDNQSITNTIANATFTSNYNMWIFTCNNAGNPLNPASYRLYTFKIYDNDVLVRDFIPCYRNSDNEVGLYDLVNNVFYTNQGTGTFTYGEVKEDYIFSKNISNLSRAINLIPTD